VRVFRRRGGVEESNEFRARALDALAAGDWHLAYQWAKGWISTGGERSIEPWLVYVASSLQHGQPRTAIHSANLALEHWIQEPLPRAVMHYARGEVIRRRLNDPKTAQADLDEAARAAPDWLQSEALEAQAACRDEVATSRKRKPSVAPAPSFQGTPAASTDRDLATKPPPVWDAFEKVLRS
jgi:hypothetical protein